MKCSLTFTTENNRIIINVNYFEKRKVEVMLKKLDSMMIHASILAGHAVDSVKERTTDEDGATMIEYIILAAVVAIAAGIIINRLMGATQAKGDEAANIIGTASFNGK